MKIGYHLREIGSKNTLESSGGYLLTSLYAIQNGENIEFGDLSIDYEFETKSDVKNVRKNLLANHGIMTRIEKI